ncbi:hypothetical protein N3R00_004150 [Escherichia coli]|uniref:Uncharacterized protein n=1 Tax=Citrobacter portucalensis TaxID=1639133 RepID=A0A9X4GS86_9ENTR|nr:MULTISPECIES: hypothetical protein [Enterobacteriaceae]EBW3013316.1 hypothetical protein [Salmonella enterica subsp. enterica serovar Bareilly]MEB1165627.1 hypothetical protein [Citrobacter freundii]EFB5938935.1 hypothetical protein [Escherichia coli]EFH3949961.1 hypothetical protein [Escherichia coli]EFN4546442.1 hypothetical protein [Escherichia coli]
MAQISFRCPDEERDAAEQSARKAGYSSLQDYLGTIVTYMAQQGTLPVVISFRPVALTPDDAFQQAIIRFREVYSRLDALFQHGLPPGKMTPLDALRAPIDDIQAAQAFRERHHQLIEMAPGQLETLPGGHTFARSREHFQFLAGHLTTAIRMVNMNNRVVSVQDREEMREALDEAARHINLLQSMATGEASSESGRIFFLMDAHEAYNAARLATGRDEPWLTRRAWMNRMNTACRQAEGQFSRLGVLPGLEQMAAVVRLLQQLPDKVALCLETDDGVLSPEDETLLEELGALLSGLRSAVAPVEKL